MSPAPPSPPDRLPPQVTTGLLDYLTAHALDEDYAYASRRRAQQSHRAGRRGLGWRGGLALACFALLVVVAAAQTSQSAASDASRRADLAAQVQSLRERVAAEQAQVRALERETARLQQRQLASDESVSGLRERVERQGLLTGTLAAQGPGVVVVADDAPGSTEVRTTVLDSDLQRLVNGWWAAGAEAIAINDQRLTTLSTIRLAGRSITVNARSLEPPYRLEVIGDPDTLPARFAESASGRAWLDLQQQVGLQLSITPTDQVRLPAAPVTLRHANQPDQDEQGVTP